MHFGLSGSGLPVRFHWFFSWIHKRIRTTVCSREYWMICRGVVFLTDIWFCSSPAPSLSPVSKLDQWHPGRLKKKGQLADGGRRGRGRSPIIRPQESLVLYKSFSTLWFAAKGIILKCCTTVLGCWSLERCLCRVGSDCQLLNSPLQLPISLSTRSAQQQQLT